MLILQLDSKEELSDLIQNAVRRAIDGTPVQTQVEELEKPLTVAGCAKYLNLSVPTIYTLISKGELPVKKRSKRCYFFASDLNNYLKAGGKKMVIEDSQEPGMGVQKKVETFKPKMQNGK